MPNRIKYDPAATSPENNILLFCILLLLLYEAGVAAILLLRLLYDICVAAILLLLLPLKPILPLYEAHSDTDTKSYIQHTYTCTYTAVAMMTTMIMITMIAVR